MTDRNVSVELASPGSEPSRFRADWAQPPADWVWPIRKPAADQSVLWLQGDANTEILPLLATVHPRSIRHQTNLAASIDRKGAEVVEEISGEVAFGTLSKLDIAIPREAADRWEVEGTDKVSREPLEIEADGTRRYRLRFAREFSDTFRLRIKYQLPLVGSSSSESASRILLAPIRVLEGTSMGRQVMIAAEPGVDIQTEAKGWSPVSRAELTGLPETSGTANPICLTRESDTAGPVVVLVRPVPSLGLPSAVVSRLWIKTVQRPENDLTTTASFWVETHEASIQIGLSPGSRWVTARVGTTEVGEGLVESIGPDEYRLKFPPSTPVGPILVAIDYTTPSSLTANGWPAPRLLNGGVVQQTIWEAQLLGTRAGVGTPSGWLDENEWYWDGLIWRRRPWKRSVELATWLTGSSGRYRLAESMELEERTSRHSYLFSRAGPPTSLRFLVFSRFSLLLLCSGPILGVGLLVLARRPPPRWTAASGLIVVFAIGALVEPNVLILVLQSSILGVLLLLTALVIHWGIERRNRSRPGGELGTIVPASSVGSTFERAPGLGSDDSTAIRVRPLTPSAISTADHIVLTRTLGRPADDGSPAGSELRGEIPS